MNKHPSASYRLAGLVRSGINILKSDEVLKGDKLTGLYDLKPEKTGDIIGISWDKMEI